MPRFWDWEVMRLSSSILGRELIECVCENSSPFHSLRVGIRGGWDVVNCFFDSRDIKQSRDFAQSISEMLVCIGYILPTSVHERIEERPYLIELGQPDHLFPALIVGAQHLLQSACSFRAGEILCLFDLSEPVGHNSPSSCIVAHKDPDIFHSRCVRSKHFQSIRSKAQPNQLFVPVLLALFRSDHLAHRFFVSPVLSLIRFLHLANRDKGCKNCEGADNKRLPFVRDTVRHHHGKAEPQSKSYRDYDKVAHSAPGPQHILQRR